MADLLHDLLRWHANLAALCDTLGDVLPSETGARQDQERASESSQDRQREHALHIYAVQSGRGTKSMNAQWTHLGRIDRIVNDALEETDLCRLGKRVREREFGHVTRPASEGDHIVVYPSSAKRQTPNVTSRKKRSKTSASAEGKLVFRKQPRVVPHTHRL